MSNAYSLTAASGVWAESGHERAGVRPFES
jgi:hypothetical protein